MNADKFKEFSEAYRAGLQEAVEVSAAEYAEVVSKRMLATIASNHMSVNYGGTGFKKACSKLGIKHTRKAILAYLEIV